MLSNSQPSEEEIAQKCQLEFNVLIHFGGPICASHPPRPPSSVRYTVAFRSDFYYRCLKTEERRTSERRHENGLYAAGRLQIRDSKVQAARRKACYQRANLTEAAQSADYRSRGDRPEAMGDVHGDCATVQPRSRRRIVDPTFPLKIPSGYAAAFGLCGFSSLLFLYLTPFS